MPNSKDAGPRLYLLVAACLIIIVVFAVANFANLTAQFGLTSSPANSPTSDTVSPRESLQVVSQQASVDSHAGHGHGGHGHQNHDHGQPGHDHEFHSDVDAIALSPQARENLGLQVKRVSRSTFTEYVEIPGLVTSWPGRTHIIVTSPLTGVINAIHVSRGELIKPNAPLFNLRLTHQDLVKTQEQFLTQLGQLDVEEKEIARLTKIASSGAVAGKSLITRQYERDKLVASVRAARQSMLLHGLTKEQIESIEETRELVREITVFAPQLHADDSLHHDSLHEQSTATETSIRKAPATVAEFASFSQPVSDHLDHVDAEFLVTVLDVSRGQSVAAGENLAQLSDYSTLLIEGHAFQRDSETIRQVAESGAACQALLGSVGDKMHTIDNLRIVSIGSEIGRVSRTLPFYLELTNEIERSESKASHRFVSWRYKPGQRLKLRLPVKTYEDVIVVPKEAVGKEGLENYVFVDRGDHLDRVPIEIVAQGPLNVAIAYGRLNARHKIALNSAHQLLMALRNQSGGGIDPHAGHSH